MARKSSVITKEKRRLARSPRLAERHPASARDLQSIVQAEAIMEFWSISSLQRLKGEGAQGL
jgi:hypothetical protein